METVYSSRQLRYLDAMGIPAWTHKKSRTDSIISARTTPVTTAASDVAGQESASWDDFSDWFSNLHLAQSDRSKLLEGHATSSLLVIEDATISSPGQRPFAGPSSRMFDAMLKAIGLNRGGTLLGTLALSSSQDSVPLTTLAEIAPRAVLFYTMPQGQHGLSEIDSVREQVHILANGLPCIVSYHPSYLMDNNEFKRAAWNDLKRVSQLLN